MDAVEAAVNRRDVRGIHLQPQAGVSLQTTLEALGEMQRLDIEVSLLKNGEDA